MTRVLVVAAHPDDEVLGAGGAMRWHLAKKDSVSVLILGEGVTSRYPRRCDAKKEEIEQLLERSRKALRFLGVKKFSHFQLPDNRFDSVDFLDIVKIVEGIKKEVKPEILYTHHAGDLNVDHRLTFQAVLTAARPMPGETVRRILSFEIPSSTEWNFSQPSGAFLPNVYLDITKHLDAKIKAFQTYVTEVQPPSHPRSPRGIRTLAELRGLQVGKKAAEAFQLIRDLP